MSGEPGDAVPTDAPEGRAAGSTVRGGTIILAASVIAGVAGYVLTWLVYRVLGPGDYAAFAVFWALVYLLVGSVAGVQQEVTRATVPAGDPRAVAGASPVRFALIAAAVVGAVVVGASPLWAPGLFPGASYAYLAPVLVAIVGYLLVAVACGALYGAVRWRLLGVLITGDAVLRLALVGIVLALGGDAIALAWAVAIPFPLALALATPWVRRALAGQVALDVPLRRLGFNSARTVVAAAASAAIVSGFPLLVELAATATTSADTVGQTIFATTLTRAPLIVVVMALQSTLVVTFKQHARPGQTAARLVAAILGVAVVASLAAWWLGVPVFDVVTGHDFDLGAGFLVVLVASSALVAALTVTGSALLAQSRHTAYTVGWVAAAAVTVVAILLPLDFAARVNTALLAGPAVGLLVHAVVLIAGRARRADADQG